MRKYISLIFISVLAGVIACQKNDGGKKADDVRPLNPQAAFEEFEVALKNQKSGCDTTLKTTYEGESFKEYSCSLTCVWPKSLEDYDHQIEGLTAVKTLADRALTVQQSRTRNNQATTISKCYGDRIQELQTTKTNVLTTIQGYNEAKSKLQNICTVTEKAVSCSPEKSFFELDKNFQTFSNFILASYEVSRQSVFKATSGETQGQVNDRATAFQKSWSF